MIYPDGFSEWSETYKTPLENYNHYSQLLANNSICPATPGWEKKREYYKNILVHEQNKISDLENRIKKLENVDNKEYTMSQDYENIKDDHVNAVRMYKMLKELKGSADLSAFINSSTTMEDFDLLVTSMLERLKTKIGELTVELSYWEPKDEV